MNMSIILPKPKKRRFVPAHRRKVTSKYGLCINGDFCELKELMREKSSECPRVRLGRKNRNQRRNELRYCNT